MEGAKRQVLEYLEKRAMTNNAVARLKIHAEQGAEAARDAEMNESNGYRIEV